MFTKKDLEQFETTESIKEEIEWTREHIEDFKQIVHHWELIKNRYRDKIDRLSEKEKSLSEEDVFETHILLNLRLTLTEESYAKSVKEYNLVKNHLLSLQQAVQSLEKAMESTAAEKAGTGTSLN